MRFSVLTAAVSAISVIGGAALAAPSVSLSAKSGHPGVSVTVTGAGFDPNTRVTLNGDSNALRFFLRPDVHQLRPNPRLHPTKANY